MSTEYSILIDEDYESLTKKELGKQIDEVLEHIRDLQDEIDNMLYVLHVKILEGEKECTENI